MKLTNSKIKQLIKEELHNVLKEEKKPDSKKQASALAAAETPAQRKARIKGNIKGQPVSLAKMVELHNRIKKLQNLLQNQMIKKKRAEYKLKLCKKDLEKIQLKNKVT